MAEGDPTLDCRDDCCLVLKIPPIGNPALASLLATELVAPVKKLEPLFKKLLNDAIKNIYCIN